MELFQEGVLVMGVSVVIYQISIAVLSVLVLVSILECHKYYKKSEHYFNVILVVEQERQKLQKQYEGKITPIPHEVFIKKALEEFDN